MLHTHMRNEMIIIYAKGHWRVHSNKSTRWIKGRRKKHLIVLGAAWSRMWSNDLINCLRSWRSAQLSCRIRENNKSYPKMYAYHGIFCLTPTQSPCVWIVMDSIFFSWYLHAELLKFFLHSWVKFFIDDFFYDDECFLLQTSTKKVQIGSNYIKK